MSLTGRRQRPRQTALGPFPCAPPNRQRKLVELLYPAEEDPAAIEAAVRAVLELSGGGGDGALHVDLALVSERCPSLPFFLLIVSKLLLTMT